MIEVLIFPPFPQKNISHISQGSSSLLWTTALVHEALSGLC